MWKCQDFMQAHWNQQLKNLCLNWIQALKGPFANIVIPFLYQELQQGSEWGEEERDTLWLHALNVRPLKDTSAEPTMFCGVKNKITLSSKIMTRMALFKKIKWRERRRVKHFQSGMKECCPFCYGKIREDFPWRGAVRFFGNQNETGQGCSFCTDFTFFLVRS